MLVNIVVCIIIVLALVVVFRKYLRYARLNGYIYIDGVPLTLLSPDAVSELLEEGQSIQKLRIENRALCRAIIDSIDYPEKFNREKKSGSTVLKDILDKGNK